MDADRAVSLIREIISTLPPAEQARVAACITRLRSLERAYGESYSLALGLLAAEKAAAVCAVPNWHVER